MSEDRYEVVRPLGTGHFTAGVYLARHRDLGREAAVKLLPVGALSDRDALLEEARNMAALAPHENVVQVLDAGDWDSDHVYIASEVCHGGSLATLCSPPAVPVDPAAACALVSTACRGLVFMHQQGLVHLDIRPANILLSGSVPKLADFGLARWLTNAKVPHVYTPHAAPEMLRDYCGTEASDQYAMAMTLAHLLTGGAACTMPPTPVSELSWRGFPPLRPLLGLNVPERLIRVLLRATKFEVADRYASIEAFKRSVDRVTPAVSFAVVGPEAIGSADGGWEIEWGSGRRGWSVRVRRNGRGVGRLSARGLDEVTATRHVSAIVNDLAQP